jgi:hypothetical protein
VDPTQTSPVVTDLTEFERQVVDTARCGIRTNPATTMTVEELAVTEDLELQVRADVLRDLLRGLHGGVDPRGILIEGVRVVGRLDLDHVIAVTGLGLYRCALPDRIVCRHAQLRFLHLNGSRLAGLDAEGLRTDSHLFLRDTVITGAGESGALGLHGARINGSIALERAAITNTSGTALAADDLRAENGLFLRDAVITGAGESGALRLSGAQISGPLDLAGATVANATGPALSADDLRAESDLVLRDTVITGTGESGAIQLFEAQIGSLLRLDRITINNTVGPALDANGLRVGGDLSMPDATIAGAGERGAIELLGAQIGGALGLDCATIAGAAGPALEAERLRVGGNLFLRDCRITGAGERGAIVLADAQVDGSLSLERATITGTRGPALEAERLRAANSFLMRHAKITGVRGGIRLRGAQIGDTFALDYATITSAKGPGLNAERIRANSNFSMQEVKIASTGEGGAILLVDAQVGGTLGLDRAAVTNTRGPALNAERLRVDSFFLRDTKLASTGDRSAIVLADAQVGGTLGLDRAAVTNTRGPALNAERLRAGSSVFLRYTEFTSTGERGAILLLDAQIGGTLELNGAKVTGTQGPALCGDRLRTEGSLFLQGAAITGSGESGAIRLLGARISAQAALLMSRLDNSSGPLLLLHEAQITGALLFPPALACPAGRKGANHRDCPDRERSITAHGLTYPVLREISSRQWLHLLVHHTADYWPQPFQHLAATERAAGHDGSARDVLVTQQHDLRRRNREALGNRLARRRHALWGWLGRYGYRANRLVAALGVVLALAAAVSVVAGHVTTHPGHLAAERVPPAAAKPGDPGTPCSPVELIGLGIDRGLPLGATGLRARCDLDTTTGWGQTFTAILWTLQALLWGLATLAIAAYTGLVRKLT